MIVTQKCCSQRRRNSKNCAIFVEEAKVKEIGVGSSRSKGFKNKSHRRKSSISSYCIETISHLIFVVVKIVVQKEVEKHKVEKIQLELQFGCWQLPKLSRP